MYIYIYIFVNKYDDVYNSEQVLSCNYTIYLYLWTGSIMYISVSLNKYCHVYSAVDHVYICILEQIRFCVYLYFWTSTTIIYLYLWTSTIMYMYISTCISEHVSGTVYTCIYNLYHKQTVVSCINLIETRFLICSSLLAHLNWNLKWAFLTAQCPSSVWRLTSVC
jgi:hypothetical protein